jgi:hypothetical protein
LYLPIFVAAAAQMVRQAKDTTGPDRTTLIGGDHWQHLRSSTRSAQR